MSLKINIDYSEPGYMRIATAIRDDLLAGHFQPGQRMKVIELSNRYGSGPNTVREALQQLSGEGWLLMEPNRGAVVRPITRKMIFDVYELLEVLERHNARKFVDAGSNNDIKELSQIQDEFDAAARNGDDIQCSLCNGHFHRVISRTAGNDEISQALERYSRLVGPIRRFVGYKKERAAKVSRDHRDLIDAFRRRDADAAEQIASQHLASSCQDILEHLGNAETADTNTSLALANG